jgi:hypothetical protein
MLAPGEREKLTQTEHSLLIQPSIVEFGVMFAPLVEGQRTANWQNRPAE